MKHKYSQYLKPKLSPLRENAESFYNIFDEILPFKFDPKDVAAFIGGESWYYKMFTSSDFKVRMTKDKFDSLDLDNKQINLPIDIFKPPEDFNDLDKVAWTITLANHYQTRQILGFNTYGLGYTSYNPFDWEQVKCQIYQENDEFFNKLRDSLELKRVYETCFDLVNQYFNNSNAHYSYFTGFYNRAAFNADYCQQALETWQNEQSFISALNLFDCYINAGFFNHNNDPLGVWQIARNYLTNPEIKKHFKLLEMTRTIFEKLFQDQQNQKQEEPQQTADGLTPLNEESNGSQQEESDSEFAQAVKALNDEIEGSEKFKKHPEIQEIETKQIDNMRSKITDVLKYNPNRHPSSLQHNPNRKEFWNFADVLKRVKTKQPTRFLTRDSGSVLDMDNLPMAKIDTKQIIGEIMKDQKKRGDPEVIMLVDISGSTNSNYGMKHYLKNEELELVQSGFTSLQKANMPGLVLCHTHTNENNLYAVVSNKMRFVNSKNHTTSDNNKRFAVAHQQLPNSSNADGIAMLHASQYFSDNAKAKILIHFSDGLPSVAPRGYSGEEHVIKTVKFLRHKGITVYSFSVVEEVVPNNNKLYGKEYNFEAYGNKLAGALQKVLVKVAEAFH